MAAKSKKASASENVARQILDDLNGAAYYADEGELANFVAGALGSSVITSAQIAHGIHNDFNGPKVMDTVEEIAAFIDKKIAQPDAPQPGDKVEA